MEFAMNDNKTRGRKLRKEEVIEFLQCFQKYKKYTCKSELDA